MHRRQRRNGRAGRHLRAMPQRDAGPIERPQGHATPRHVPHVGRTVPPGRTTRGHFLPPFSGLGRKASTGAIAATSKLLSFWSSACGVAMREVGRGVGGEPGQPAGRADRVWRRVDPEKGGVGPDRVTTLRKTRRCHSRYLSTLAAAQGHQSRRTALRRGAPRGPAAVYRWAIGERTCHGVTPLAGSTPRSGVRTYDVELTFPGAPQPARKPGRSVSSDGCQNERLWQAQDSFLAASREGREGARAGSAGDIWKQVKGICARAFELVLWSCHAVPQP